MKSIISLFLILSCYSFSKSATFTVTNTNDTGAGSLRQAITDANTSYLPDIIAFNIPTSDLNYNSSLGTWSIKPATAYPYLLTGNTTIDATTQASNQGNTNPLGSEIVIDGSVYNDHAFLLVSPSNTIKGFQIVNFVYGVQIYGTSATQNIISNNFIGTNNDGTVSISNEYGITISNGSTGNTIKDNLISGNISTAVFITESNNQTITGNKIGTTAYGLTPLANMNGILIDKSTGVVIGGNSATLRNIISGNSNAGILINDILSSNNTIKGNYIGTDISGTLKIENGNGILVVSSGNNTIGGSSSTDRNIISGNLEAGILFNGTGTRNNIVKGNYIGTDVTGMNYLDNHVGIMLKSNSDNNIIGGSSANDRNIISGNSEIGVYMEASDSNIVIGNYIGPDVTGTGTFAIGDSLFQANGVEFNTVSKNNRVGGTAAGERNIISGNRVYGLIYYGNVSENTTIGNYIGTDVTGTQALPNATGICVDGGSNHNNIENNVLSGNISYGIFIVTSGTYYNTMKGNLVGTNYNGTDSIPNDAGLLIGGGAKYNVIGGTNSSDRNIFSGNRYIGIEIADNSTDNNEVRGNYIGTDISGNYTIANGIGIGLSSMPSYNIIDNNVISGNKTIGLILFENSDSNFVSNNFIGLKSDGISDLGNGTSGILIANGSKYNQIGWANNQNYIAYNDSVGIAIMDNETKFNKISANNIYKNGYLGIDIFPWGINFNDTGDSDSGANDLINFPEIFEASWNNSSILTINGLIDSPNPDNIRVELFGNTYESPYLYGDGEYYLGYTTPDINGNWSFSKYDNIYYNNVSATATDINGNTSEFSQFNSVGLDGINENSISDNKIFPNPFISNTTIYLNNSNQKSYKISITDITGKEIISFKNPESKIIWNGKDNYGNELNSGIYFVKIQSRNEVKVLKTIKM